MKGPAGNFFILDEEMELKPSEEVFFQNIDHDVKIEFKIAGQVVGIVIWNIYSSPKKGAKKVSVSTHAETQIFQLKMADRTRPFNSPNLLIT